jgi:hypothetical protein
MKVEPPLQVRLGRYSCGFRGVAILAGLRGRRFWQSKVKGGSPAQRAVYGDFGAVLLCDPFGQRQSQAGSAAGVIDTVEALEDTWLVLGGDPDSRVANSEVNLAVLGAHDA